MKQITRLYFHCIIFSKVDKIIDKISGEHFKNYNVSKVVRNDFGAKIYYGGENEFFDYDKVVIATHADQALDIIDNPTSDEEEILKNFMEINY